MLKNNLDYPAGISTALLAGKKNFYFRIEATGLIMGGWEPA